MSGKHTRGPWFVEPIAHQDSFYITNSAEPFSPTICQTWGGLPEAPMPQEANARLIAAAPDLLDLVRTFRDYASDMASGHLRADYGKTYELLGAEDLARIDAAIAKAEGRDA